MMNEVSYSSISAPGLNREILNKPYKNSYNFISENAYNKPEIDSKEPNFLKKTINRLEQNMNFMQHEHCQMLEGLQKQIEKLREENQDLQFQLVMRSDRPKDPEMKNVAKNKDTEYVNAKLVSDKISLMKLALDEERRKNKDLLAQLELLQIKAAEVKDESAKTKEKSEISSVSEGGLYVSPEIRISLNPLMVSTYQHDSGLYLMKTPLTVADCEMVIQTLLKKIESAPDMSDQSGSSRSFSGSQQLKIVPGIKKPLQPLKPLSRGSTSLKLNQICASQYPKSIGLPSNQKLVPILSQKNENPKIEQDYRRLNVSRKSDRQSKHHDPLPIYSEGKTGSSLPALPKPSDFNQAEKHRRLHLLQRKRLDQFNNRS